MFFLILTLAIVLHECGHYFFARRLKVGVLQGNVFFDPFFSVLRYEPRTGRLSVMSRPVSYEQMRPDGSRATYIGEKALLSIPVHAPEHRATYLDDATQRLVASHDTLVRRTILAPERRLPASNWRNMVFVLGWLPFGGYVKLRSDNSADSMQRRTPREQLMINAGGVIFNFVGMVAMLLLLKLFTVAFGYIGWLHYFMVNFAYICFLLMLFNLLPIPGLDGGNIVMNIVAMVRPGLENDPRIRKVYNWLSMAFFFIILSSWFRPASGIETGFSGIAGAIFGSILSMMDLA